MWSESTFATNAPPGARRPGPSVAPLAGAGYREKKGPGAILFPSSRHRLCVHGPSTINSVG